MRIRAAVLEETRGALAVQELELAAPGPHEVLVRLRASGVCHSDLNAIDGTAETPCPAVLGHEGAGVVEAVGEKVTRVSPETTSRSRGCRPAASAPSAPAASPGSARRRGRRCRRGARGRHDPALARRRAGLPLLLSLHLRGRCVVSERSCVPIARHAVRHRSARRLRRHHRRRRGGADRGPKREIVSR